MGQQVREEVIVIHSRQVRHVPPHPPPQQITTQVTNETEVAEAIGGCVLGMIALCVFVPLLIVIMVALGVLIIPLLFISIALLVLAAMLDQS
ncbi:MAG: hypothetical protein UY76_C0034G0013 [Candidatus Uhrbacteria bacterium GW2011_GWA2_52_8d]|uniref:Uncharacterized protein n=1 Tax=Candidatus Uhrbacteria bacterium GW2011_GWA2_52_8d TaxID=1618979 RepID=A0A0G1XMW0_9BACT|nr:MAG: hypothetical protein UY76_C0034G0013 [Candidatus Uhrbacteria bacterium GW2011_GWA2_52_8d]